MRILAIRAVLFDDFLTSKLIVISRDFHEASLYREDAATELFVKVLGFLPHSVLRSIYEAASVSCDNHHEDESAQQDADDNTERE